MNYKNTDSVVLKGLFYGQFWMNKELRIDMHLQELNFKNKPNILSAFTCLNNPQVIENLLPKTISQERVGKIGYLILEYVDGWTLDKYFGFDDVPDMTKWSVYLEIIKCIYVLGKEFSVLHWDLRAINSLGLDAFHMIEFAIVPKEMLHCIRNEKTRLNIDKNSVILHFIISKYGISSDELKSFEKQANDRVLNTNIKYIKSSYDCDYDSDVSF